MASNNFDGFFETIDSISSTSYTLIGNEQYLRFTSNSSVTLTINADVIVNGWCCVVEQAGTGQITFAGTSTRVNSRGHTKTYGQYSVVFLICSTTDTVNFFGDTA